MTYEYSSTRKPDPFTYKTITLDEQPLYLVPFSEPLQFDEILHYQFTPLDTIEENIYILYLESVSPDDVYNLFNPTDPILIRYMSDTIRAAIDRLKMWNITADTVRIALKQGHA